MKMEYSFLAVALAIILYGGWSFLKNRLGKQAEFSLYLAVKDQENCLEGIIRTLFHYLSQQETSLCIILLVEKSSDQTLAIAQRLARRYFFQLIEIEDLNTWLAESSFEESNTRLLLDLRGKEKGLADARRIRKYVGEIRLQQSKNN